MVHRYLRNFRRSFSFIVSDENCIPHRKAVYWSCRDLVPTTQSGRSYEEVRSSFGHGYCAVGRFELAVLGPTWARWWTRWWTCWWPRGRERRWMARRWWMARRRRMAQRLARRGFHWGAVVGLVVPVCLSLRLLPAALRDWSNCGRQTIRLRRTGATGGASQRRVLVLLRERQGVLSDRSGLRRGLDPSPTATPLTR